MFHEQDHGVYCTSQLTGRLKQSTGANRCPIFSLSPPLTFLGIWTLDSPPQVVYSNQIAIATPPHRGALLYYSLYYTTTGFKNDPPSLYCVCARARVCVYELGSVKVLIRSLGIMQLNRSLLFFIIIQSKTKEWYHLLHQTTKATRSKSPFRVCVPYIAVCSAGCLY